MICGFVAASMCWACVRERLGQGLHRDVTIELGVAGTEDLPHAAFADRREAYRDRAPTSQVAPADVLSSPRCSGPTAYGTVN